MARRHYRVVKKEIEQSPAKGIFIPNKAKPKLAAIGISIMIFVFLKGLLLGYLAGKHD